MWYDMLSTDVSLTRGGVKVKGFMDSGSTRYREKTANKYLEGLVSTRRDDLKSHLTSVLSIIGNHRTVKWLCNVVKIVLGGLLFSLVHGLFAQF